jgi:hypothetical protein
LDDVVSGGFGFVVLQLFERLEETVYKLDTSINGLFARAERS